jgi:predicted metal-binding membrane protein
LTASADPDLRLPARGSSLLAVVRVRLGLIALLVGVSGMAWWWTAGQMSGMDNGPWTGLGRIGWFVSVWIVMMAAMMFPSVAPTVGLYSHMTRSRSLVAPLLFAGGYLVTWAGAGVAAFAIAFTGGRVAGDVLAWNRAGRWAAGAALIVAAVYELTPLKDVCLGKCRSPLGALLGSWRDGSSGAVLMGVRNGAWCVGCCWALMASLFALGIMSVIWMALIATVVAAEKLVPWRRAATHAAAVFLAVLGVLLLLAPQALPGLTIPSMMMAH